MSTRQVTRHEFEAMASRLDTFIIRSEFEQFKALNDQQRATAVASIDSRLSMVEQAHKDRGKLPNGWASLLSIIAVLAAIAEGIAGFIHH